MEQLQNDGLEYVVDDHYYDMVDFDEESFEEENLNARNGDESDNEVLEDANKNKDKADTSALEARNGKDIQGIQWERLNFTRNNYREMRLKQYKNFENLSRPREDLGKEYTRPVEKGSAFYDFHFNTRIVKPTIVHFQALSVICNSLFCGLAKKARWSSLCAGGAIRRPIHMLWNLVCPNCSSHLLRNLLWATSKHDVYLMQNYSVMHWSSLLRRGKEVINVAGPIMPTLKYPSTLATSLSRVQISTMHVKDNLVVAGGFHGELICKYLDRQGVNFCTKVTDGENAITNAVEIYQSSSGANQLMTANNDSQVRVFDTENFVLLSRFTFDWSINNTSVNPDSKLLAVLGDSTDCLIADAHSGKIITTLKGHLDYSFSSAWHPNGQILATGNQDRTCRLWDVRNLSTSLAVLKGRMGAIRAIKFASDGRFMAIAEPADFVHIYDTKADYCSAQEIDLFGEIAGISFSPDAEALFIGVADRTYGSLLEFNRRHWNHQYSYSLL